MQKRTAEYRNGIWGVIIGDALGEPVQFMSREEIADNPVRGMESGRLYLDIPAGTWTDDSSLTLALLDSINTLHTIDLTDIMERFCNWLYHGAYTPDGQAFDIGGTTRRAIDRYSLNRDVHHCGGDSVRSNGNGSLMRIMPACLYVYEKQHDEDMSDADAISVIHDVSELTHAHLRSRIACGLYYFCVRAILDGEGSLSDRIQKGIDAGFAYYRQDIMNLTELAYYGRIEHTDELASLGADSIRSTGYVVDSLEAAIWSLVTTSSFPECELKAVNLADDSDSVAAIAGGLAGLYYGYEQIPEEWIEVIRSRECIDAMIESV